MSAYIVRLSGPSGSGKTSVCRLLHRKGIAIVAEPVSKGPNYIDISQDQKIIVENQKYIIRSRIDTLTTLLDNNKIIILDRWIDEDVDVFCKVFLTLNLLSEEGFSEISSFAKKALLGIPKPNCGYYLSAPLETLKQRLIARQESSFTISTLSLQILLYKKWLHNFKEHEDIRSIESTSAQEIADIIMERINA